MTHHTHETWSYRTLESHFWDYVLTFLKSYFLKFTKKKIPRREHKTMFIWSKHVIGSSSSQLVYEIYKLTAESNSARLNFSFVLPLCVTLVMIPVSLPNNVSNVT
ncbi:uncharacterized protein EV154DRAFT_555094 [Mucor mucedo]|uniref:uncharacterized protein n=1 Tax=Mucor mucedo TaxID=29922 RepID=UPI002220A384|nr:uncharacterized protein EV154DRAFT_555094 [Mucor mucedo]KAI7882087.1 hypothetical protein EV154DRAFT_555094 [Mucor mucedo]